MKQNTTRKILNTIAGEKAARVLSASWNWLWGLPVESGGKLSLEVAKDAIATMEKTVFDLAEAVAKVTASYQKTKQIYENKQKEAHDAEKKAKLANENCNIDAARLAMTHVITIEKILPQLANTVKTAEQRMISAHEKLKNEQKKLQLLKLEMSNLNTLTELNQAMGAIFEATTDLDIGSAKEQFLESKSAIQDRNLFEVAKADLAENPTEKMELQLDKLSLDEEVTRRLAVYNK